jgi:hypothetical protein
MESLRKIEEDIVGSAGVGKRRQRPLPLDTISYADPRFSETYDDGPSRQWLGRRRYGRSGQFDLMGS